MHLVLVSTIRLALVFERENRGGKAELKGAHVVKETTDATSAFAQGRLQNYLPRDVRPTDDNHCL